MRSGGTVRYSNARKGEIAGVAIFFGIKRMEIQCEEVEMLTELGISIYGNKTAISHDFTDAVASIDYCGGGVRELIFNTEDGFKVRIVGNVFQFQSLALALIRAGVER